MRGFVIFLGLLLMLGGGAVAGAQYAPIDLSTIESNQSSTGSRFAGIPEDADGALCGRRRGRASAC